LLRVLLRRRGLVLVAALVLMVLTGVAGSDAATSWLPVPTWTPRQSRNAPLHCWLRSSPAGRRTWSWSPRRRRGSLCLGRLVGARAWPAHTAQGVQGLVNGFHGGRRCGRLGPGGWWRSVAVARCPVDLASSGRPSRPLWGPV